MPDQLARADYSLEIYAVKKQNYVNSQIPTPHGKTSIV